MASYISAGLTSDQQSAMPTLTHNVVPTDASQDTGAEQGRVGVLNNSHSLSISTLTLLILFFIFKPSLILNITQLLSLSLFYI